MHWALPLRGHHSCPPELMLLGKVYRPASNKPSVYMIQLLLSKLWDETSAYHTRTFHPRAPIFKYPNRAPSYCPSN